MAMFTGMMTNFLRDAINTGVLSGNASAIGDAAPVPTPAPTPAPLPTLAVPPVVPYSSMRALALPAAATGHPMPSLPSMLSLTQPMLGMSGLAIPLSGHSTTPRRSRNLQQPTVTLVQEGRYSNSDNVALEDQQYAVQAFRVPKHLRVTNLVQAYQPGQEVVCYKNFSGAFATHLINSDLSFDYNLPEDTRIVDILEATANSMCSGPRRYSFGVLPAGPSTQHRHESLELQALSYVNLGKNRGTSGSAHLRREAIPPDLTLASLFTRSYKNLFAVPTLSVVGNQFILHSIVRYAGLTFITEQFTEAIENNWEELDDPDSDTSGGVPAETEDEEDEDMPEAPTLTAATVPSQQLPSRHSLAPISAASNPGTVSSVAPTTSVVIAPTSAPAQIMTITNACRPWGVSTFEPESGPFPDLFDQHNTPLAVYQYAGDGTRFELNGNSLADLAFLYVEATREATLTGDFTSLLSANRRFQVFNSDSTIHSFGAGLERETIFVALNMYVNSGRWCLPTDEGRMSIGISMPLRIAHTIPDDRLKEFRVFGALVALSLVSGKPPGPLTPALLQYVLNGCNLQALTPSFVASWNPELDRTARSLQAIGPDGNLAPFQSHIINYLNIQSAPLAYRDQIQHNTLVHQLVHSALLGPEFHGHPETVAFCEGLDLPCANGFTFSKYARSYPGGTEFFLAHAWTSHITDFNSIDPHISVMVPSNTRCTPHFGVLPTDLDAQGLFIRFLQGSGNPCSEDRLEGAKPHFSVDVIEELANIDKPFFRPKLFCWAATGSPFLDPNPDMGDPINIDFVLPGDLSYSDTPSSSAVGMAQGLISFRTCSRVVRIPMSKLVELRRVTYPTQDYATFEVAAESWFFLQTLNAVGKMVYPT
ncbi:hypothetical protein DFH09DRAFT_1302798 [Mycena vulgaris]|nr:hypothetical protein DFH09DRAFT_1302798 [Mycena vulgaris]